MSSRKRKIWLVLAVVLLLLVFFLFLLYRATKYVPDFYRRALALSAAEQQQFGEEFKQQLAGLKADLDKSQQFEMVLSEDQINGWLSTTVAQEHQHRLPPGMRDPRVAIRDGEVRIGSVLRKGKIQTVVWLVADLKLTDENTVLEIQVSGLKAGLIPFSIERFQQEITDSLKRAKLEMTWVEGAEELTVRVQLPDRFEGKSVQVERLELQEGGLLFSGRPRG